ncbi:pimeloyl-ACP methyl ester carboxylesterase [Chitinophaga polysaccharea]|uniref:Pimeloyl-ACP methyl ester carboxylesterase n=1 Tax=Chitinophaga polysaccharea TaxID=1293035 RepID=A0A561PP65_9BACT|nr:alpha/beta hydrolase [Chitinophaga polysaccharea]TWF39902.1 pimeloyl-ACP methyl ester carboxylesterase [Chitinophaga polysaccharea]
MQTTKTYNRRHFLGLGALALGALSIPSYLRGAVATNTSLGPFKQINAGVLNIGYAEMGPAQGVPVILLHGWPYDVHSYQEVAPALADKGYRVIVPHLRGHGTTTFLDASTMRTGQQAAVALDIIALMDALHIKKAILAGYDWGTRTANIIGALWPERVIALVCVNGYLVNNREKNKQPLSPQAEWSWWYQYYFATERGREGLKLHREELARLIWKFNSPKWAFDDKTFQQYATSFHNVDYTDVVIHNYRWRLGLADGDPRYDSLEQQLATGPVIRVPSITLDGDADGIATATDGQAYKKKFTGKHVHHIIPGAGHNLPAEAPGIFTNAIIEAACLTD